MTEQVCPEQLDEPGPVRFGRPAELRREQEIELRARQTGSSRPRTRRIAQPALAVRGDRSVLTFAGRRALLESWLPDCRPFELPGATHLLHVQEPGAMASALAAFFARHPVAVGSPSA